MSSIRNIIKENLLQESGIRDIKELSDRYDKAKIYFHQDLDGITSALGMKYYLENNGIRVVDSEVIQYGDKEFSVKKTDARGDVMPVLVDFAHSKPMFVIHTDHHDTQAGVTQDTATSFRHARSNVETISQILSPSDVFPSHDIMMISTVDSADFVKRGISPDDVMNFVFQLDKEGQLDKNKTALALVTNKLLLSYKNKPDFLESLVMNSTPSLMNIYQNIKRIAQQKGYPTPEEMKVNQDEYIKSQKNNPDVQYDDYYGIIKQYGGGALFKPGSYDRYTPFKNNPDANFLSIAWPMGLLQVSCNPFQSSRSLKGVNLGEISQEVLSKFEDELRNKELTLDSMKYLSEKSKQFDPELSVGFTYHDFMALYGDSAKVKDRESGEDVLIKSYGTETQGIIKDIVSKPYSKMNKSDLLVANKIRVSAWDVIQANSGGHKCITNIHLTLLGKESKDYLIRIQNEFIESLKDKIDQDTGKTNPNREKLTPIPTKTYEPKKLGYDEVNKTVTYKYEILEDDGNVILIRNVQASPMIRGGKPIGPFSGGKWFADVSTHEVTLPKSQIEIGDTDEEGLTMITIPYWLYSKNKGLRFKTVDWDEYQPYNG